MKTSDILNKAAEVMIEKGHCQNQLRDWKGSVCIMGAIIEANGGVFYNGIFVTNTLAWLTLENAIGQEPVDWNFTATEAMAIGALHEAAILAKEQGD